MSEVLANPQSPNQAATQPAGSKRGLYMAIGSIVTVAVLAIAALQAPKFFRSSSADTSTPAVSRAGRIA